MDKQAKERRVETMAEMSTRDLIKALRVCASATRRCVKCPLFDREYLPGKSTCHDLIMRLAARRLEEGLEKGKDNEQRT